MTTLGFTPTTGIVDEPVQFTINTAYPINCIEFGDGGSYCFEVDEDPKTNTGTATGGSSGEIQLGSEAVDSNGYYNGMYVEITDGTGAGQIRLINYYYGAWLNYNALITPSWSTIPDNTSKWRIFAFQSATTTHAYKSAGTYPVTLRYTGSDGNPQFEYTDDIIITEPSPDTGFYTLTVRGKGPLDVAFINEAAADGNTYAWDFGDGETSTDTHPVHTYANPQTYTVKLIVTNSSETQTYLREDYICVTETDPPQVGFTHTLTDNTDHCPVTVTFTNTSTGTITSYLWDFGDGITSTDENPTHTYSTQGFYLVKLSAFNDEWEDEIVQMFYIRNPAPSLLILPTPASGFAPLAVTFSAVIDGPYIRKIWDFGDNTTSTLDNPSHTYSTPGTYTVTLTVYQQTLLYPETATKTVIVKDPATLPQAEFSADVTSGAAPLTVTFTDESTGTPTSWLWDFGDGNTSTSQNPEHTYSSGGVYTVSLMIRNADGGTTETKEDYIAATAAPVADFEADVVIGWAPLTVQFTDTSTNIPTSWSWDFDDTGSSSDPDPEHTFTSVRSYWVELTATNATGSDTVGMDITVVPSGYPLASFTYLVTTRVLPFTVQFTDTSVGSGNTYLWDFGDGSTSTDQNPTHIYRYYGEYVVSLTVENSLGKHTKKVRISA